MARTVTTHLMFDGTAEAAMRFYVGLFAGSEVTQILRYGPGEPGAEGTVRKARFTIAGREFQCIDSPVRHAFSFTPSISLLVDCEDEGEIAHAFEQLSASGAVMMPLDDYGFSRKFAWVTDRFGVSWQLNLP